MKFAFTGFINTLTRHPVRKEERNPERHQKLPHIVSNIDLDVVLGLIDVKKMILQRDPVK